jgi:hypothetical protein
VGCESGHSMSWVDDKMDEREFRKSAPDTFNPDTVQQHNRNLASATEAWTRLIEVIRADVGKFNARSPVRRVNVSATAEYIDVYWGAPSQTALMISRKLTETTAKYNASQKPDQSTQHEGTINLLTESTESLSARLLAPVLFD